MTCRSCNTRFRGIHENIYVEELKFPTIHLLGFQLFFFFSESMANLPLSFIKRKFKFLTSANFAWLKKLLKNIIFLEVYYLFIICIIFSIFCLLWLSQKGILQRTCNIPLLWKFLKRFPVKILKELLVIQEMWHFFLKESRIQLK